MRSFRRTLEFLRPYRWRVVLAVLLTLAVTFFQVLPPRIFEAGIDQGIKPVVALRQDLEQETDPMARAELRTRLEQASNQDGPRVLQLVAGGLFLVIALRAFLNYLLATTVAIIGHRFCFDLRFATWKHLQRLSMAYHKQTQTGKVMSRATGDIELIQGLIQGQLVTFFSDIFTLVAVVGMLFFLEWRIALIIAALVPFYVIAYLSFLKHIRALRETQRRLYDIMVGFLAEKISGIAVVKAFVRERRETESFMVAVRNKFAADRTQMHLNARLGLISGVISALGTGIVYSYGGWLVQSNQMTVGQLVAITFYIGFVFNPAVRVVDFNTGLQWAIAAMDRVFATLDTRPDIEDRPGAPALPPFKKQVVFDNVSFRYGEGDQGVFNLNLKVAKGEVIGIVGHSGAGKTTMMNLLMRFYDPSEGRILVDGHNLRDVRLDSVRRQMSLVAQENVAFSVSIAENIRYGHRDATLEQVIAASKAADLHEYIESLEDGYDTLIGERGTKLSGGQRQRLALARALVTDPAILILDDVTSALDGETEAKVQEALRRVMKGRTTFIIAHRLSSVVEADRIVVMEAGRLVDIGTHAELVDRPGIYQDLFREQFRSALEPVSAGQGRH